MPAPAPPLLPPTRQSQDNQRQRRQHVAQRQLHRHRPLELQGAKRVAQVIGLADLAGMHLLVRERGSGTRATLERLFKDARLPLRIGSEMSSNEAIKQMCAAGFGVAFLSMRTCVLELEAGLLELLPMAANPVQREWFVMRLASRQLSQAASAFERFLIDQGQDQLTQQLKPRARAPAAGGAGWLRWSAGQRSSLTVPSRAPRHPLRLAF